MKIIYIHQHFSTRQGATGTRSYEMSRRLIRAGHQVVMVCGAYAVGDAGVGSFERVIEQEVDGIHVIRIPEPYGNEMSFARRLLAFGRFARAATKVVCGLKADLVFATSTPLSVGIPGMKGARRLGVPFVFEVRDLWPEVMIAAGVLRNPFLIWYSRRLERTLYRVADRIIALAPGMKEGICRTGISPDKVVVIPNSSDLDLFRPCELPLNDERFGRADEFRLVYTGAHGLMNGLDAVLDAAVELKRRGESGVRFVFIGQGAQRQRLMDRSQREGIASMVSWVPSIPKEELARVLPGMDVGLMILKNIPMFYYASSPNKFFDYIACGLPVLNNYPGWLADMIRGYQCGRVVPPDDPVAFADAVVWLRDHRDEIRDMGRRSRRLAESQFSRDSLGDLFVKTLEETYRAGRQ